MTEKTSVFEETLPPTESVFAGAEEFTNEIPIPVASNAAAMGSFVMGSELPENYDQIKRDLVLTGQSEDLKNIAKFINEQEREYDLETAQDILIDPTLPIEEKSAQIDTLKVMSDERGEEPLHITYTKDVASFYDNEQPAVVAQQEQRVEDLEEVDPTKLAIEWIKPKAVHPDEQKGKAWIPGFEGSDVTVLGIPIGNVFEFIGVGDASFLNFWSDAADLSVPFSHTNKIQGLYTHMMGEEPSSFDSIMTGEMYHRLSDTFIDLSNEDKIAWAEKMVEYVRNQEGWFKDHNSFEAMVTVEALLNTDRTKEDFDWDRLIENIIVPLDAIALAGWAKVAGKTLGSVIDIATRYNPDVAADLSAARLLTHETGEAVESLGSSTTDLVLDSMLPGKGIQATDLNGAAPEIVNRAVAMSDEAAGIITRYQASHPSKKRLIKEISEGSGRGVTHVNKTWATTDPNTGLSLVHTIVGATSTRGYTTAAGAKRAATTRGDEIVQIHLRNKSGAIVKATKDDVGIVLPTKFKPVRLDSGDAIPKDLEAAFTNLGSAQRGKPEAAMLKYQHSMGGGVMGHALEHIGDLTHRMSHFIKHKDPLIQETLEKTTKMIRTLGREYGFLKEHTENLANNAEYKKVSLSSLKKLDETLRAKYVAAHKKLPVYNEPQWRAREAAVAVGELRIEDALEHLKWIDDTYRKGNKRVLQAATTVTRDDSGAILEFGKPSSKTGEFFYEVVDVEDTNLADIVDFSQVKPLLSKTPINPTTSKYFRDVNGLFGPEDSLKLGAIDDLTASIKDKIRRIDRDLTNLKLSNADKNASIRLLARGSKEGRVIPYEEAIAGSDVYHGVSPKAYESYLAKRVQSDLSYVSADYRLLEDLKNKGYNLLDEVDGEYTFGRKIETGQLDKHLVDVRMVLDAGTGKPIPLTSKMRKDLEIRKAQVYKLRAEERIDDAAFEYMYVADANIRKVRDLPAHPLKYIKGYVYRKHLDRYFIEVVDKVSVNGKPDLVERAVVRGAADTPSEAASRMETISEEFLSGAMAAKGAFVRWRPGRELVANMSTSEASFELARITGLIHRGRRGPLLDKDGGDLSNLRSTHESLQTSISQAAGFMGEVPLIEGLERQFAEFFGDKVARDFKLDHGLWIRNNDGVHAFPLKSSHIVWNGDPALKPLYNNAVSSWDWINMAGRYQDPVSTSWKGQVLKYGIAFDDLFNSKTGHKVADILGKKDPLDLLRTNAFIQFLALNPFRQLPLQASQHLILGPLAPTYVSTGRALKDSILTLTGASVRHDPDAWRRLAPILAKTKRGSLKDFEVEVDEWLDTGMAQSLDSHQMLNAIMPNAIDVTGRSTAGQLTANTLNSMFYPIRLAQKLGFNAGELSNLASTWHVIRFINKRDGIEMSPLEVGQRARQMALSMTHAGSFGFQEGWLKETAQFQSFQLKAILSILGDNPAFTKPQRYMMAGTQFALFGTKGLGVGLLGTYIADKYKEVTGNTIPLEWKQSIIEGAGVVAINWGLQKAAKLAGLEPEDYENSFVSFTSFAPLSGSTYGIGTIFDVMFGSKTLTDALIGPGGVAFEKFSDTFKAVKDVFFTPDPEGDKDYIQVTLKGLDIIARGMSSGISNYHKGRIAAEVGYLIDKENDEVVKATLLEAWAKASAGLGTYDAYIYRMHQNDKFFRDKEERAQAKRDVSAVMHLYDARHGKHSTKDLVVKMGELTIHTRFADEQYKERYRALFMRELLNKAEIRNGQKDLFQDIMRDVYDQTSLDAVYDQLLELVPAGEEREFMRVVLDSLFVAEPTRNLFEQGTEETE